MAHTCSDGTQTRLVRDSSIPIGQYAQMSCPRCGWTRHGATIITDTFRALAPMVRSPFVLRAMAAQLPAKEL